MFKNKKTTFKKIVLVLALICIFGCFVSLTSCDFSYKVTYTTDSDEFFVDINKNDNENEETADTTVTHRAFIEVEGYGTIELDLYGNEAPITVARFVKLASEGFYNGLTFHRIMDNFMIQGGDPKGNSTGRYEIDGVEQNIVGEFSDNNIKNDIKHVRGTISMARGYDYNSGSCQFFIVHQTSTNNTLSLDGKYAAFGMVTSGIEIVDQICLDVIEGNNGLVDKEEQPVIRSITIEEIK